MPTPKRVAVASVDDIPRTRKEWHAYVRELGRTVSFSGFDKRCSTMGTEKAVAFTIQDPWTPWNAKGLCAKGHKVEGDNAYVRPNLLGTQRTRGPKCKICMSERQRERMALERKPRVRVQRTVCPAGHKLTPDNVRIVTTSAGYTSRICKKCQALYMRERERNKKLGLPTRTKRPPPMSLQETFRRYSRPQPNGCVLWAGRYLKKKSPLIAHKELKPSSARLIRPYLWEKINGKPFPKWWDTKASCGDYRCIAEAHLIAKPRVEFARTVQRARAVSNGIKAARSRRVRHKAQRPTALSIDLAKYIPTMRAHICRAFKSVASDVDDIVQEALIRLHRFIEKNGPLQHLQTALMIARTAAIDHYHRTKRRATMEERLETDDEGTYNLGSHEGIAFRDPVEIMERYEALKAQWSYYSALMRGMPARQRQVFQLRAQGMSQREISESLGISQNTVEQHLNRAYTRVRACGLAYYELLKQELAA